MERYWDLIKEIVKESDIVLEILDARFPEMSRNLQAEEIIKQLKKPRIFVLNKADLISRKDIEYAVANLSQEPDSSVVYVTNRQTRTIKTLLAKIRQMFEKYGRNESNQSSNPLIKRPFRKARGDIIVGVIGYPNVGKSSVINALSFSKKMTVSKKAGTTHGIHWIKANEEIKLIDTPGVIPLSNESEMKLGMISARGVEKLKDPELVAGRIIESFIEKKALNRLEDFYGLKFEERENVYFILTEISKHMHHLKKGGETDDIRTSSVIVRDWQEGRLKLL